MTDTIESVQARMSNDAKIGIHVHEIIGDRHTVMFEDGRVSKITYCNGCGSAFSIGTSCATCACSSR